MAAQDGADSELQRDNDRTGSGEPFGDDVGQLSGTVERDQSWNAGGVVTRRADDTGMSGSSGKPEPIVTEAGELGTVGNADRPTAIEFFMATGALDTSHLTEPGDVATGTDGAGIPNAVVTPDVADLPADDSLGASAPVVQMNPTSTMDSPGSGSVERSDSTPTATEPIRSCWTVPMDDGTLPGAGDTAATRINLPGAASAGTGQSGAAGIAPGMEVVLAGGDGVGHVKELGATAFLVDRRLRRDIWVPFAVVASLTGQQVRLSVADDIDDQGWESPPLLSSDHGTHKP